MILAGLAKGVWDNPKLTTNIMMQVYQACMVSILFYGTKSWTLYSFREHRLNTFHLCKPQENFGYHVSSPRTKQERPQPGRHPQHVCTPDSVLSAVAWPHPLW